ncbi:MAG TPA: hypothetical protein VLA78_07455 [Paracoccaceae bacterium]|nr:hypothetical protein [Paracoccaceae bacterium]
MFNVVKKSIQWGDETLTLETGRVARTPATIKVAGVLHSEPSRGQGSTAMKHGRSGESLSFPNPQFTCMRPASAT